MPTDNSKYYQRFKKEEIFLKHPTEDYLIRSHPKDGYFIKNKGKEESSIASNDEVVVRSIDGKDEVTKKVYESF